MGLIVERWPVYDYCRRYGVPLFLDGRLQSLPGSNSTEVDILLGELRCCTGKRWMLSVLVEAFAVTVVERYVTYGAIGVCDSYGGYELSHIGTHF